jgi:hypothetical protein
MLHRDLEARTLILFENRVLRRISRLKWKNIKGSWRKCNDHVVHDLYSSPDIFRTKRSRRIRRAGHTARTKSTRNAHTILILKEGDYSE